MRLRQVTRGLPSSQVEELSNETNEKLSIWELEPLEAAHNNAH